MSRLFWVSLLCFFSCQANAAGVVRQGVADLRHHDFSDQKVILKGDWGFYWKQLIAPDSVYSDLQFAAFPVRWNELKYEGKVLPAVGYASYSLTLLLPENSGNLAIDMPDVYTAYRVYLNGRLLGANGSPDSIPERAVPRWERKILAIPAGLDSVHLVLHVANYWHSKGGPYKPVAIGQLETLLSNRRLDNAFDLVLFGCLLMGGLFFLGLYSFGRHDKVILFFALFCLTYAYRIVGTHNYVLHQLLPDLSWHIAVRLEYFSLFASVTFFCFYTLRLYPVETNTAIMRVMVGFNIALSALVIVTPPSIFTKTINPFLVLMFAFTFYSFWVYIQAYRNKRLGSGYALWSTAVVLCVVLLINFQYFGIIMPDKAVIFFGYILFFFLQSLILSYRFAEQLDGARRDAENALRVKSEFLSTMSHEIRTPLNSVIGMTHILLKDKPRADQQEQLNVLLFAARNLLSIVNDILDYNKIEAGKITFEAIPVDVSGLTRNIFLGLRSQGDEKSLEMQLELGLKEEYKLLTDPTRLSQVLVNLLHNAIKFTRHGKVLLRVGKIEEIDNRILLRFEVIDTGIGIAPEKQQLIFERFTQADSSTSRSFGGTGLGLSIARRILELQGSKLQLDSEPDKGSRFFFDLWMAKSKENIVLNTTANQDLLEEEQQGKPLKDVNILLVEDNALNVMVAKAFLQRWGAQIEVATNGQEAIDQLDANKHQLVLMDLHMPVMDGYEATRQLRARGESLPIIALTASLPKEVESDAFKAGLDAVVVKPFNPDDLRLTILRILGSR